MLVDLSCNAASSPNRSISFIPRKRRPVDIISEAGMVQHKIHRSLPQEDDGARSRPAPAPLPGLGDTSGFGHPKRSLALKKSAVSGSWWCRGTTCISCTTSIICLSSFYLCVGGRIQFRHILPTTHPRHVALTCLPSKYGNPCHCSFRGRVRHHFFPHPVHMTEAPQAP